MCRAISMTNLKASKSTIAKRPALRKRQRNVRFSEIASCLRPKTPLSQEEIDNTWYSRADEHIFKQNAARDLFEHKRKAHFGIEEAAPRGLERHTRERRTHKKEAVQLIVLAFKQGYHPDDVAAFSQFRSSWNTDLAKAQANVDQLEASMD